MEQCGSNPVPGFSLSCSQSCFAFYITRKRSVSTNSREGSNSMCSCTATAMVDFCIDDDEIEMFPYVNGLDIRQNRAGLPLGMIAALKMGCNYYLTLHVAHLFLILG